VTPAEATSLYSNSVEEVAARGGRDQAAVFRLGRRPELNGLRGFAILAVMLYHADETFLKAGFIGVDFFFVVSGFLITALLVEEFDKTNRISLKQFYMRRVLRLAPALLAMLLVYSVACVFLFGFPKTYQYWEDALIVLFYSTNWARAFFIHGPYHLGHGWSLSVEEQFYALWPLLLYFLLRKVGVRWVVAASCAALALAALGWRNWLMQAASTRPQIYTDMRIYNGLDTRADALMVGCFLGILLTCGFIKPQFHGWAARFMMGSGVIALALMAALTDGPTWNAPIMFHWLYFGIEVLTAVVILDCIVDPGSLVKRLLSFPPLVWIGSISYGLYLWHYPIYVMLKDKQFGPWQVLGLGMSITFVIATISFYALEQPFLNMKKRFSPKVPL
jgi:peptidoglycan/LPS O-acetylase OafA/YrhL